MFRPFTRNGIGSSPARMLRCVIWITLILSRRVRPFSPRVRLQLPFIHSNVALRSSPKDTKDENNKAYRSISDVVGGLHGGKYQFGGPAQIPSYGADAFGGVGSMDSNTEDDLGYEDDQPMDLPNWALKMEPTDTLDGPLKVLSVPSNSNPMDGMTYFASFVIQNQERTWEPFFVKVFLREPDGTFINVRMDQDFPVVARPKSGVLAPRGGSSDRAEIQVMQDKPSTGSTPTTVDGLEPLGEVWIVAGTEEEQWSYQLRLE